MDLGTRDGAGDGARPGLCPLCPRQPHPLFVPKPAAFQRGRPFVGAFGSWGNVPKRSSGNDGSQSCSSSSSSSGMRPHGPLGPSRCCCRAGSVPPGPGVPSGAGDTAGVAGGAQGSRGMLRGDREAGPSLRTGSGMCKTPFLSSKNQNQALGLIVLEVPDLLLHRLVSLSSCRPGMSLHVPRPPLLDPGSHSGGVGQRPPSPGGCLGSAAGAARAAPPGAAGLCRRAGSSGLCSCFLRFGCVYSQHE